MNPTETELKMMCVNLKLGRHIGPAKGSELIDALRSARSLCDAYETRAVAAEKALRGETKHKVKRR